MDYSSSRTDLLADGIFAIVMTILVFEIKVPELAYETNLILYRELLNVYPLFLSYILSFATLFTFWRGYHAVAADFAKSTDLKFQNIAGVFLLFVALVPFTSHLLGLYSTLSGAVTVFAFNVMLIGLLLLRLKVYATKTKAIRNKRMKSDEIKRGYIRILFPIVFAFIAIFVAHASTQVALTMLTLAILFNMHKRSSHIIQKLFNIY